MKKHGFTLAEVLISLGIVAVVAALTAPSLINLMPDKSKLKVIKAHKILSDVTSEMLNNPALYRDANCESWPGIQTVGTDDVCVGLGNGDMPLAEPYNTDDYKYEAKYPNLLDIHRAKLWIMENNAKSDEDYKSIDNLCDEALSLYPFDGEIMATQAKAKSELGEDDKAMELYKKSVDNTRNGLIWQKVEDECGYSRMDIERELIKELSGED